MTPGEEGDIVLRVQLIIYIEIGVGADYSVSQIFVPEKGAKWLEVDRWRESNKSNFLLEPSSTNCIILISTIKFHKITDVYFGEKNKKTSFYYKIFSGIIQPHDQLLCL